eukprot:PLAT4544.1.p1 GENE.PLAT4544.1~~PLAT4544.1.p1  ORF type:complete len:858 (-),score=452.55 PLAT4544.1:277-2784(-)
MAREFIPGAEFSGAGQSAGLEIWRIEAMVPTPIPAEDYGKFFSGDSYIVLYTSVTKSGAFEWAIHFWLGSETSQDEAGVAAYKTVELDTLLGGGPVQYREVQEHETALFMSYFKPVGGIEYMPGGVDSGFTKVERDVYRQRLLQVKGRRNVRVKEVECSARSLNEGDVFILDCGLKLYLWMGTDANRQERVKGADIVRRIKDDERGGRATVYIMNEEDRPEFWEALGGRPASIASAEAGGDDDKVTVGGDVTLYKVSDASGHLEVTEVPSPSGKLSRDMLDTADVFILDTESTIFVWIGKGTTSAEKSSGMTVAQEFIASKGKPAWTQVTRLIETGETPIFKSYFGDWTKPAAPMSFGFSGSSGVAKAREQHAIDVAALHASKMPEEDAVDDGSGELMIWRIEDFAKAEVPPEKWGQFYAGDSYIILYTYNKGGRPAYIIYFWQGRASTSDEKGASALLAKELDDSLGGSAVQVRVVQGKEPLHFCNLFRGHMIVHAGGKASGFKSLHDADSYDTDGVSLFHIKGTTPSNTRATQVEERASSLNSGDCFVLLTPGVMFVWNGSGSNAEEQTTAANIAEILREGREVVPLAEGAEPEEFWGPLGGRGEYPSVAALGDAPREPRLFQCSNATGVFEVEEIFNFAQEDLVDDDVMLLDTYEQVFVWVGSQSNDLEKRMAIETAQNYVAAAKDGRDSDCPLLQVKAGGEPQMFTCHFLGWDAEMAERNKFVDPYQARMAALRAEREEADHDEVPPAPGSVFTAEVIKKAEPVAFAAPAAGEFVPYEALKGPCPPGVDPTCKEQYLSDAEFMTVFGCSKAEFASLKKWKRNDKKKAAGLF